MTEAAYKNRQSAPKPGDEERIAAIRPVSRTRVSDEVLIQLTNLILDGVYNAGDKLPPERELSNQLGVNRASLREALRRMEVMGLVFIRQGGGIYVQDHTTQAGLDFVQFLLQAGIHLDKKLILNIAEVRIPFVKIMLSLAAQHITDENVAAMEEIVGRMAEATLEERRQGHFDSEFFIEIAKATQNRVIVYMMNTIRSVLTNMSGMYFQMLNDPEISIVLFPRLIRALKDGDAKKAHRLFEKQAGKDDEALFALLENMD